MREWRSFRRRPKADQRVHWIQGRGEQTNYRGVTLNRENRALNQFSWQAKIEFAVQCFESEQDIAILSRNYWILNVESTATRFILRTAEKRNREILKAVDEKSKKFDKNSTVVQQGINICWNHTLSLGFDFFVSPIHVRLSSLSDSPIIWMPKDFASTLFLISAKDFGQLGECNQDFVAPALCHMPIEVVSVRVEAPAWRENAFWSCVFDRVRQRCNSDSNVEWENGGIRRRPKADHRAKWNQGRDLFFKLPKSQRK